MDFGCEVEDALDRIGWQRLACQRVDVHLVMFADISRDMEMILLELRRLGFTVVRSSRSFEIFGGAAFAIQTRNTIQCAA